MQKFKVGDWAEWTSTAGGSTKTKQGECVAVVPPGGKAYEYAAALCVESNKICVASAMAGCGVPRDHESYIFALPASPKGRVRKLYWPRVSGLSKIRKEDVCKNSK